jgi:7-keto-8-aminopelargonate synthetase-like enzyme
LANVAVFTSLIRPDDVVFNDQLNHASIIDGSRMSPATIRFYKHNDISALEKKLNQYPFERPKMIVTDGVFSMDGDIARLDLIVPLAKKHNALVMLDDAHAIGVVGANGRGTAEHYGLEGQVDITIATFSKALGTMGGAVCGSKSLIKFINHHSRQFIFSTAIVPSACATALAALEVLEEDPSIVARLHSNRRFLSNGLKAMGYKVIEAETAIIPVFIGDERKTYAMTHLLGEYGVFVNAVSRPSVPRELSRIRLTPMATHTEEQLSFALDAFKRAGKQLSII